jgi:hypothetical protein
MKVRHFFFVILGLDPRIHAQASDINGLGRLAAARENDFDVQGLGLDPRIKSEDDESTGEDDESMGRRMTKARGG